MYNFNIILFLEIVNEFFEDDDCREFITMFKF